MKEYWIFSFLKDRINAIHFTNEDKANAHWLNLHQAHIPTYTETVDDGGNVLSNDFHDVSKIEWKKIVNYDNLFDILHEQAQDTFGDDFMGSRLYFSPKLNAFEFTTKRRMSQIDPGLYEEETTYVNAVDRDSFFSIRKFT